MIDKVSIGNTDTSVSGHGGRILNVKVSSSKSFTTPTRPLSVDEIRAKSFLGYRGELDCHMATLPLFVGSATSQSYQKFLKNNGTVKNLEDKMQSASDRTCMIPHFPILQIASMKEKDTVPLKIAYEMQRTLVDIEYISMPPISEKSDIFKKMVVDWCESAERDMNSGVVPQISLNEDPSVLANKLDALIELSESEYINVVNLVFATPKDHINQYAQLWERRDKMNFIINCSQVPKGDMTSSQGMVDDYEPQLMQYGIDSISRRQNKVSSAFIAKRNMEPPKQNLDDVDNYEIAVHDAAMYIPGINWRKADHEINCNCSICRGNSRKNIIDRFAYKDNGDIESAGLRYFSIIHDHQSDQIELEKMKSFIKSNGMIDYMALVEEYNIELSKLI
ncbi:MAG: hypothetical protein WCS15_06945 [Prevotella sp.]